MARFTMTNSGVTLNGKKLKNEDDDEETDLTVTRRGPRKPSRIVMTNSGVTDRGKPIPKQTFAQTDLSGVRSSKPVMKLSSIGKKIRNG